MNDLLSICIPTYNRAEVLRGCLESLIPQAKEREMPIYVSDNASTDNTAEIVLAARKKYPHIYYSRNSQNLGADCNIECVLKMSKTKYAWLFGDRQRLFDDAVDIVSQILNAADYELVVVNKKGTQDAKDNRVKDIAGPSIYTDPNKLLGDLGWHMTAIDSLIFGPNIISGGDFNKYHNTYFVQFGVTFDYLANKSFKIYWHADPLVYGVDKSAWVDSVFEIYIKKWIDVVQSLPSAYDDKTKLKCIKDNGVKSDIFGLESLVYLRGKGIFNYQTYLKNIKYFSFVTNIPTYVLFLISITPIDLVKAVGGVYKFIKKHVSK